MTNDILTVKDLNVIYKTDLETVYAVNGIAFSLQKGRTLGIVGETGAGKTTTALAIMRLLPGHVAHVKGSILLEDTELTSVPEHEMRSIRGNRIAMVFQDPMTALNPVLTVGNQIGESIMIHYPEWGKQQIEETVDRTLTLVGIPPSRKNDYPHQFSGGMKQRVVIAIALASKPELLIADEPTTALDVTIQAQILQMMNDLKSELNTSMILITHDMGIVVQMCDEVAVMYAGEFVEYGSTEAIYTSQKNHPYTKGLFGSLPNLKEKTRRLNPIKGLMPDPTNLPSGCKFHPRCPMRMDICSEVKPPDYRSGSHMIKCHLFADAEEVKP